MVGRQRTRNGLDSLFLSKQRSLGGGSFSLYSLGRGVVCLLFAFGALYVVVSGAWWSRSPQAALRSKGRNIGYSLDWISLRAKQDLMARDKSLIGMLSKSIGTKSKPLVVDVGSGTGALRRALAPKLPRDVSWRMVDHDPKMVADLQRRYGKDQVVDADMAHDFSYLDGADVVAATAFYDLVSDNWLDSFVAHLPKKSIVYAALTYNGKETWEPSHPQDARVMDMFQRNHHHLNDFGMRLGGKAASAMAEKLKAAGWRVHTKETWWAIQPSIEHDLAGMLTEFHRGAAVKQGMDASAARAWASFPRDMIRVGHVDMLAFPAE